MAPFYYEVPQAPPHFLCVFRRVLNASHVCVASQRSDKVNGCVDRVAFGEDRPGCANGVEKGLQGLVHLLTRIDSKPGWIIYTQHV